MDRFAVNLVKTSKGKSMPLGIGKKNTWISAINHKAGMILNSAS
jgi:hypothetical protein